MLGNSQIEESLADPGEPAIFTETINKKEPGIVHMLHYRVALSQYIEPGKCHFTSPPETLAVEPDLIVGIQDLITLSKR